eukprot:TRINITY_DN24673_c0_g1_i1.p1 TRINITY_DN24673_c0_g1~~TRINITY_DN24673_c0_g1_i1.p1  ORF type:complete len:305 (-),score=62.52 TRINITY_DN24673_c0_g1_i1:139-1053(-)
MAPYTTLSMFAAVGIGLGFAPSTPVCVPDLKRMRDLEEIAQLEAEQAEAAAEYNLGAWSEAEPRSGKAEDGASDLSWWRMLLCSFVVESVVLGAGVRTFRWSRRHAGAAEREKAATPDALVATQSASSAQGVVLPPRRAIASPAAPLAAAVPPHGAQETKAESKRAAQSQRPLGPNGQPLPEPRWENLTDPKLWMPKQPYVVRPQKVLTPEEEEQRRQRDAIIMARMPKEPPPGPGCPDFDEIQRKRQEEIRKPGWSWQAEMDNAFPPQPWEEERARLKKVYHGPVSLGALPGRDSAAALDLLR